jgi:hypothetical protein
MVIILYLASLNRTAGDLMILNERHKLVFWL